MRHATHARNMAALQSASLIATGMRIKQTRQVWQVRGFCHLLMQQHENALLDKLVTDDPEIANDKGTLLQGVQACVHAPQQHLISSQIFLLRCLLKFCLQTRTHSQLFLFQNNMQFSHLHGYSWNARHSPACSV